MAERADRRVYWSIRAEARVSAQYTRPGAIPGVISMIIDGMDQGKFAVPRFPFTKSKDVEGMQRPRLHVNVAMCHGHEILVTVSDANFPKDTNGTCEVIAHMLTRLSRQQQVAVHRCALHVQLDNTSAQNKNNILLGFLAWLTTRGVTLASEADFLRKGHTHEDVDQLNGQICSYMHRQPYAETPHDFVRHIQRFLDTELAKPPWPQGPGSRRCVYLNQQRDWKTFLRFVPALKQHTGPQAPHVFRYQRRGCCAPGLLRRLHCIEPLGIPADDRDAVLFCKRWMADESLSQRPLVQLPASKVPATEGVPMALQRNPITPKLANHLKKYSGLLARPPYKVERGASTSSTGSTTASRRSRPWTLMACSGMLLLSLGTWVCFLLSAWALTTRLQWWPWPTLVLPTTTHPATGLPWPTAWLLSCTSPMASLGTKLLLQGNAPRAMPQRLWRDARRPLGRSESGRDCLEATLWTWGVRRQGGFSRWTWCRGDACPVGCCAPRSPDRLHCTVHQPCSVGCPAPRSWLRTDTIGDSIARARARARVCVCVCARARAYVCAAVRARGITHARARGCVCNFACSEIGARAC